MKECPVCYLPRPCDREIHAATLRVHAWLRRKIERALEPPRTPQRTLPGHPNQFFVQGSGRK
jgi:hypothetical protein